MKISIIGLGKMGCLVQELSQEQNIKVISTIDPKQKKADFTEINKQSLKDADVCICFTQPAAALDNIKKIAKYGKKIVMATTGWEENLKEVKKIVQTKKVAMIYTSNFSIGVNIFFKIVEQSAKILNNFNDYDVFGLEMHHNRKLDSPSGTAKTTTNLLLQNITRKKKPAYDKLDRKILPEELHFASVRGGDIAGKHLVCYDSEFDNIEIKHTAKTRLGFAKGALLAAKWLMQKKTGFFSEKDLIDYLLKSQNF